MRLFRIVTLSAVPMLYWTMAVADSHEIDQSCILLDADNDGVITNAEFANKKVELFRSLDPDDDGFIARQDVEISDEGFDDLDRDKDGKVSAYEFVDSKIVSFAAMDLNSDGAVTLEECNSYVRGLRSGS